MQSDIELAITGLGNDRRETLVGKIPRAYTVEDRSATGYGLVVRSESSESSEEISTKLESFLKPLLPLAEAVRDCVIPSGRCMTILLNKLSRLVSQPPW